MTAVYECENQACTLGTPGAPGRFTGGAAKEAITLITGDPEPDKHGEGVCPNCGTPGKKVGDETPHKGNDPYQELHDKIGGPASAQVLKLKARADDPEDEMTTDQMRAEAADITAAAQEALTKAVERAESKED